MNLRAISIRQPYVEQILAGEKIEEYRSYPIKIRGWIALHASKSTAEDGHEGLPLGALVGFARLVGRYADGGDFAWKLAGPVRLVTPIQFKGAAAWFPVPWDVVKDAKVVLPGGQVVTVAEHLAG